jgi:alkaline phosphatase D
MPPRIITILSAHNSRTSVRSGNSSPGPLHAGTYGPNELDATFGPEVRFASVKPGAPANRPPSDGFQFFGLTRIAAATKVMTVELRNLAGETIYSVDLEPT